MANSGNIITAPVRTVADVLSVLGISASETTGKASYICGNTHGKINKWAKFKPVAYNSSAPDRSGDWWKGNAKNCGITYTTFATISAGITAIKNRTAVWGYQPPTGGSSSPYRIGDFGGYDAEASAPMTNFSIPIVYLNSSSDVLHAVIAASMDDGYCIKFRDFAEGIEQYYFSIIVYNSSGTQLFGYSADVPIGTDAYSGNEIQVPYSYYRNKLTAKQTYTAYALLTANKMTGTVSDRQSCVPLPYGNESAGIPAVTFSTKAASRYVYLQANAIGQTVNWQVEVYGAGNNITGSIRLRFADKGQGDAMVMGEYSRTLNFSSATQVTAGDGTIGYRLKSTVNTAFTMLDGYGAEDYKVDFVSTAVDYTWVNIMYSPTD